MAAFIEFLMNHDPAAFHQHWQQMAAILYVQRRFQQANWWITVVKTILMLL